jgi:FkbM family methyltransferase
VPHTRAHSLRRQLKERAKRLSEALGVAEQARDVYRALESPRWKRERLDNLHMALLAGFLLGPDDSCVDLGCNRGRFLETVVRVAPRARHIAYEPIPVLHSGLAEQFPDVDVRLAAVADEAGETTFVYDHTDDGMSTLRPTRYAAGHDVETLMVRVETLDEALAEDFAPRLIKMDIEGAEYPAMKGAFNTIATHRPAIVFELWKGFAETYGYTARDVYELLCDSAGLRLFDLDANGPFTLSEFEAAFELEAVSNFVAHR